MFFNYSQSGGFPDKCRPVIAHEGAVSDMTGYAVDCHWPVGHHGGCQLSVIETVSFSRYGYPKKEKHFWGFQMSMSFLGEKNVFSMYSIRPRKKTINTNFNSQQSNLISWNGLY